VWYNLVFFPDWRTLGIIEQHAAKNILKECGSKFRALPGMMDNQRCAALGNEDIGR